MRQTGAVPFRQNEEQQTSSRCMMVEAFAQIDAQVIASMLGTTTRFA